MNKNILGFLLIACLQAKSASGSVVAVAVALPDTSMTTQTLYDTFNGDPGAVQIATDRIRLLLNANNLSADFSRYSNPRHALFQITKCRAENRKEFLQLLRLARILNDANLNDILLQAVQFCRYRPYKPIISTLLEVGASPLATNVADDSLLHIAVASDQREEAPTCVRILLQHRANPNVLDRERYTPLHRAIINGHIEKAIELVEGNADINVTTPDGNTALHLAVMSDGIRSSIRKPLIMSILARADADIRKKNSKGLSPLALARKSYRFRSSVEPVDFSSVLNNCTPCSTHYQAVEKFAKTVKELEDANQADIDNANKAPQSVFSRLFGTAPQPTKSSGSNPASTANPASGANPASSEQKPFLQSTEFKAIVTISIAAIIGKIIHSKLVSIKDERARVAMKTIHGILETKSSIRRDLEAFYTTLDQTADVSIQANELQRLFELSELKALNEEIQCIMNHNNKKLNKELKEVFQEHTEFFEAWQKIFKFLSPSAHTTTKSETPTIFEEVCATVSAINDAVQAGTTAKKP